MEGRQYHLNEEFTKQVRCFHISHTLVTCNSVRATGYHQSIPHVHTHPGRGTVGKRSGQQKQPHVEAVLITPLIGRGSPHVICHDRMRQHSQNTLQFVTVVLWVGLGPRTYSSLFTLQMEWSKNEVIASVTRSRDNFSHRRPRNISWTDSQVNYLQLLCT